MSSKGKTSPSAPMNSSGTIAFKHTPQVLPWPMMKYPLFPHPFPHEFRTIHSFFSVCPTMVIAWLKPLLLQSVKGLAWSQTSLPRFSAFIMVATAQLLMSQSWMAVQFPEGSSLKPEILYFLTSGESMMVLLQGKDWPERDRQGYSQLLTSPCFITYSKPFLMLPPSHPFTVGSSFTQSISCCSDSFTVMLQRVRYRYSAVAMIGNEQQDEQRNWSTASRKPSVWFTGVLMSTSMILTESSTASQLFAICTVFITLKTLQNYWKSISINPFSSSFPGFLSSLSSYFDFSTSSSQNTNDRQSFSAGDIVSGTLVKLIVLRVVGVRRRLKLSMIKCFAIKPATTRRITMNPVLTNFLERHTASLSKGSITNWSLCLISDSRFSAWLSPDMLGMLL